MATDVFSLAGGEVIVWAEPKGPLCIRAVTTAGDPVELAEREVHELIAVLQKLLAKLE